MSNMKLKSGVAPIQRLQAAGVNLALGCDNCSCGDCQSMFQAMKLTAFWRRSPIPIQPEVHAHHAVQAATWAVLARSALTTRLAASAKDCVPTSPSSIFRTWPICRSTASSAARVQRDRPERRNDHCRRPDRDAGSQAMTVDEVAFRTELEDIMPAFRRISRISGGRALRLFHTCLRPTDA